MVIVVIVLSVCVVTLSLLLIEQSKTLKQTDSLQRISDKLIEDLYVYNHELKRVLRDYANHDTEMQFVCAQLFVDAFQPLNMN